jgi:UDP-N-acetylmuramoylalanine--D-glutamate ligase
LHFVRLGGVEHFENPVMRELQDKKVLVIGHDASGQAAVRLCVAKGARVSVVPAGPETVSEMDIEALQNLGAETLALGDTAKPEFDLGVLSQSIPRTSAIIYPLIEKNIPVVSDLELAYQHFYCLSLAITGTNGKTTTAELVEEMFTRCGRKTTKAGGSDAPVCEIIENTRELDFATLEVNSFQLESIGTFRPSVAVLLNLKPDHMDRYERISNYARTLARVFMNQQPFDWAIIQSEALAQLLSLGVEIPSKVITFSANNRRADLFLDRSLLISRIPDWDGPLLDMEHLQLRGPHNAENVMAALAVGRVLTLPLEEMIEALKAHVPGPHRCEVVAETQGVKFINDSKAMNMDAVQKALQAAPAGRGGEPNIWLIAGGKDKGLEFHDLGPLLAQRVKGAFLLGEMKDKLRAAWSLFTPCTTVTSLPEAVQKAGESASAGDVVLLSPGCSSFDMFQNYQRRGEIFREAVADWIHSHRLEAVK